MTQKSPSLPEASRPATGIEIAVDIGGTFTDLIAVDASGRVETAKLLSSPPEFGRAVEAGIRNLLGALDAKAGSIRSILHGMTVATNAILEGRGSVPALVTTRGFPDVLDLATGRRPDIYNLMWAKPPALTPRWLRFELDQRITSRGELDPPADIAELARVAEKLKQSGVKSAAVCLINSHIRPDEEQRVTAELSKLCPDISFTASVDISPYPPEYERTSTAVVNAYVCPPVSNYLQTLQSALEAMGVRSSFHLMRSNGGLMSLAESCEKPVFLIESGPAAGVVGAVALSKHVNFPNLIAFDMGGTTAKASLIENGKPFEAMDYEVGAGMNSMRGHTSGAGHMVKVPSLDIAEVGAGGGSILWIDSGGAPRVGPKSAGAQPGPACYGLGGTQPTVTDAAVVLGYFNPHAIAGGAQPISVEKATRAIASVADRLGLSVQDAAYGAIKIAVASMTLLLRGVTTQRGRDPREYAMIAFGGSGPVYAADVARSLNIPTVIVPPAPGLFSSVGLLVSDPVHDVVRHHHDGLLNAGRISSNYTTMRDEILAKLLAEGNKREDIEIQHFVDMRYAEQKGIIRIAVPPAEPNDGYVDLLVDQLDAEHQRTYGHGKSRSGARIVNQTVRGICRNRNTNVLELLGKMAGGKTPKQERRAAYFGPEVGSVPTQVISRAALTTEPQSGPIIVEEMDSTIVIPPWASARIDDFNNIIMQIS